MPLEFKKNKECLQCGKNMNYDDWAKEWKFPIYSIWKRKKFCSYSCLNKWWYKKSKKSSESKEQKKNG